MNKPSPKIIGAFVTAALLLMIGMVMFLGSASLLSKSTRFILFFDQSVNGLNVGSKVKFRGVPVGSVERIMIRVDGQDPASTAIPVIIKIDRTRLANDLGVMNEVFDPISMKNSIDRGLVAELSLESFITGQLFVELSFASDPSFSPEIHLVEQSEMMEIPTLSSTLDQITDDAAEIIARLSTVDLERLQANVNRVLENTAEVLAGIDSREISRSMVGAADSLTKFVESGELSKTLESAQTTLSEISETTRSFNLERGPLAGKLETWTTSLTTTMEEIQELTSTTSKLMAPDGSLRYELENMLRELGRASRSIRILADYLEENPNSILTGRPAGE
ncbi:MAG: MlaD family protein [Opitutales bacterium]